MQYEFELISKKFHVSRETFLHLENYVFHLKKWQEKINLISAATLEEVRQRHILDSLQLLSYIKYSDKIIDIGSGAGFPGMVLAISGMTSITLVESDMRKVAFLREIAHIVKVPVTIIGNRIEKVNIKEFDVITCRAFMSLEKLLLLLHHDLLPHHVLLLLKGENYMKELEEAKKHFEFDYENFPSITQPQSFVSRISHIKRKIMAR